MSTRVVADRGVTVTAPNGVTWTRRPEADTTPEQFLAALSDFLTMWSPAASWSWWREGQAKEERKRIEQVVFGWDNGAPESTPEEAQAFADNYMKEVNADIARDRRNRKRRAARQYDPSREANRLRVLRLESDAAFFTHVAAEPDSTEQRAKAESRAATAITEASALRDVIGRDLEDVVDAHGFTPAERREQHLRSHIDGWRHRLLREWHGSDKRRFKALLAMPPLSSEDMCSECEAPTAWHDYDISIRLFHPEPERDSRAEALARLLPGWWGRCPACTAYKIEHAWGGKNTLPGFTGEQWLAMLPPLLRAIYGPAPERKPRPKAAARPKPLAVIPSGLSVDEVLARLAKAQQEHPEAEVRRGSGDGWELWAKEPSEPGSGA